MKRYKSIIVGAIFALMGILSSTILCTSTDNLNVNSFDENNFIDVTYNYKLYSQFKYNDSMMLTDANNLSGDLTKISVNLAVAAYEQDEIVKCLGQMEYDVSTYNYEKTSTYENNDFVAYSIGYKPITYNHITYNAYVVSVRGTKKNCEWFSNFNLGNRSDGYHEGFKLAADEVLTSIKSKVKTENNIFLITGHSRGAAVANIVAGELSTNYSYATQNHIHAYTFACPAVRLNISGTLNNIKNYNNMGDVIASIPLEEWEYSRYGINMPLSSNQEIYNNFKTRFKSVYGEEYGGKFSTDSFVSALKSFANTREDYYSAENKFLFDVAGWYLGERTTSNAVKVVNNHNVSCIAKKSLINILVNAVSGTIQYGIDTEYRSNIDFLAEIDTAITNTAGMDQNSFDYWVSNNYSLVRKISDKTDIDIKTRANLVLARNTLESSLDDISYMATSIESIINLFYSTDGKPIDAVFHAHTQETYVLWIHTMYYGYKGWYGNIDVEDVRIDSNITTVGNSCFKDCSNLYQVIIDNNVKCIGDYAFAYCRRLTVAVIGDSVRKLGVNAFAYCSGLTSLTLPISAECQTSTYSNDTCFQGLSSLKTLHYTLGTGETFNNEHGPEDYDYCGGKTLTTVTFDEGIKEIVPNMFSNCTNLTTVKLPSTLEIIGDRAFYNTRITGDLTLPDTLTYLGESAFCDTKITGNLVIPDGITELKYGVFRYCTGLESIKSTGNVTKIGSECFSNCSGLKEVIIGDKVEILGVNAFAYCSGLTSLTLPISAECQTATYTTDTCFQGLSSLKTLHYTLGTGETFNNEHGPEDYDYCGGKTLTTVIFDEGIKEIVPSMFSNCTNLTTVKLPSTLEIIGDRAFYNTRITGDLTLPDTLTYLGESAFCDTKITGNLVIPDGITELKYGVFRYCTGLESIKSTGNVTKIGSECFSNCSGLKEVIIGDKVEILGVNAFAYCSGLTSLTLPISAECQTATYTTDTCFQGLSSLNTLHYTLGTGETFNNEHGPEDYDYCGGKALTTVIFDEGIKEIVPNMFSNCTNLTTVKLPSTLEIIGDRAFYGTSNELIIYGYIDSIVQSFAKEKNIYFAGYGDANGDNLLNVKDATKLQKYLIEVDTIDEIRTYTTDVNGDGVLNICDVTYIQKYLVDYIEAFPI